MLLVQLFILTFSTLLLDSLRRAQPAFFNHRGLHEIDLAVLPCLSARKVTKGEQPEAGTARFFVFSGKKIVETYSIFPFFMLIYKESL